MTIEEALKLTSSKVYGNRKLERELADLYFSIFNERLVITCNNCVEDGLFRIKHFNNKSNKTKTMITPDSKFRLFPNIVLYVPKWHMHITNGNLTDKIAIDLLRMNIKNLKNFEKYPPNYIDLVKGTSSNPIIKAEPTVVSLNENIDDDRTADEVVEEEPKIKKLPSNDPAELIKLFSKVELIELLKERGVEVDGETINTKKELAQTLIAFDKG